MKLPQLLSLYLYQTRKLDLPGIGSFELDASAVIPDQSEKNIHAPASGITFKNVPVHTAEDGLIQFIRDHTGKMKPLASADLDFFLTTGKQLLNIGKPFYIEGIGTLLQNKEGKFDFTPGEYSTVKLDEPVQDRRDRLAEQRQAAYEEPRADHGGPSSNNSKQVVLLLVIIIILVGLGWGGYHLYKKNTFVENNTENTASSQVKAFPDTTAAAPPKAKDTITAAPSSQQPAAGTNTPATGTTTPAAANNADSLAHSSVARIENTASGDRPVYRFVILETTRKERALKRYNQLLGFQLNIKMYQKDSSYFKLYFPISAAISDTSHIRDSLALTYAAHVRIEK